MKRREDESGCERDGMLARGADKFRQKEETPLRK